MKPSLAGLRQADGSRTSVQETPNAIGSVINLPEERSYCDGPNPRTVLARGEAASVASVVSDATPAAAGEGYRSRSFGYVRTEGQDG